MYVTTMISRMDFLRPTRSAMGAATQHPYPTQLTVMLISMVRGRTMSFPR
jgi:hypothetical protein